MRRFVQLVLLVGLASMLAPALAGAAPRMYAGFHDDPNFRWGDNRPEVLDQARGAGAGSALLAAVADEARRRGHAALEIWSHKRFEDAHRLYTRHGARVVGERVHDDPDSSREWGLLLDL